MVARHAALWSIGTMPPVEEYAHKVEVLEGYCREIGRDPKSIRRGIQSAFVIARDEAELRERAGALKTRLTRHSQRPLDEFIAILKKNNFAGTAAEIAEKMRGYQAHGVDLWMLQHFVWDDDDTLRALISDLAPLIA